MELLTNIYSDRKFRNDYFKWLRMNGYKQSKMDINTTVVEYENYLYAKLNSSWLGKLRYEEVDLVDYKGHEKQIKAFLLG